MQTKTKPNLRPYKSIIIERLNKETLPNSHSTTNKKCMIHTLKTQCTPNQHSQQIYEKIFEDFQSNFKISYKAVDVKNKKTLRRSLYAELLQIQCEEQQVNKKKVNRKKCVAESKVKSKPKTIALGDLNKKQQSAKRKSSSSKLCSPYLKRELSTLSLREQKQRPLKRTYSKKQLLRSTQTFDQPNTAQKHSANYMKKMVEKRIQNSKQQ